MISRTSLLRAKRNSISFMIPSITMGMGRRPIAIRTPTTQQIHFSRHSILKTHSDNPAPIHTTATFQVSTDLPLILLPHSNPNPPHPKNPTRNPGNSTSANSTVRTWPRTAKSPETGSISLTPS